MRITSLMPIKRIVINRLWKISIKKKKTPKKKKKSNKKRKHKIYK